MPQHANETEMVGVQAGQKTAHISSGLPSAQGLHQCQNVALSGGHGIRVPPYNLWVEPGDSSVVGPQTMADPAP